MTKIHGLSISIAAFAIVAAPHPVRAQYEREPNRYTDSQTGEVLEYNIVRPNGYDPNAATHYPLMVCLHAAGSTNPPNRTLSADGNCWVGTFNTAANQATYPSFYMIPISQTNSSGWGDAGPNSPITQTQKFEGRLTVVVVRELLTRFKIDPNRLYITGPSMGARGTWDIIRRNPTMFAAAAPAAGPAAATDAALYASQNIWSINGENDSTAEDNRNAIAAIRAAGGNPIYTELANHGHDSWRTVYPMPEFMAWMFAQRRGVPWWNHPPAAPTMVPGATLSQPVVVPPPGTGGMSGFPGGGTGGTGGSGGVNGGTAGISGGVGGQSGAGAGGAGQPGAGGQGGANAGAPATSGAAGTSGFGGQGGAGSGGTLPAVAGVGPGGLAGATGDPAGGVDNEARAYDGAACNIAAGSVHTPRPVGSLLLLALGALGCFRKRSYLLRSQRTQRTKLSSVAARPRVV